MQCTVSLGFSELRMRNNERELLDSWIQEHPCERLLDIGTVCTQTVEVLGVKVYHYTYVQTEGGVRECLT